MDSTLEAGHAVPQRALTWGHDPVETHRSGMERSNQVVLGPEVYLHTGIHGALQQSPPSLVEYVTADAVHTFLLPTDHDTLFSAQSLLECVEFGEEARVVHSAYWPVLNASHWITETDDLGYVLFGGLYSYNPEFLGREARRHTRSARFARHVRARLRNMLTAFAHVSCRGLLVNTGHERARALGYLSHCDDVSLTEAVSQKLHVLYPGTASRPSDLVSRKWATGQLTIVFCGRGFEEKRGDTALRAFRRVLQHDPSIRCLYIGDIPDAVLTAHRDVMQHIRHYPELPRDEVLAHFDGAHILFHPGISESVGAVFVEAAAAGMVIVTAQGHGYEHMSEWFGGGGASFVDRNRTRTSDEPEAFTEALLALVREPMTARAHGEHNHRTVAEGPLSLARRDALLGALYADVPPQPQPLSLENFPREGGETPLRLSSHDVVRIRRDYLASVGFRDGSLEVLYEP